MQKTQFWEVRWSNVSALDSGLDQAVWIRVLAGYIVLYSLNDGGTFLKKLLCVVV